MLLSLQVPLIGPPDLALQVDRSREIATGYLGREIGYLGPTSPTIAEDGSGIAQQSAGVLNAFARFGPPYHHIYLRVYEAPAKESPYRRTILLGREPSEAYGHIFPPGKQWIAPPGYRAHFLWGRIGAQMLAGLNSDTWLGATIFPGKITSPGHWEDQMLFSILRPSMPGIPSKALFSSADAGAAYETRGHVMAVSPIDGLTKFALLYERVDPEADGSEIVRLSSFLFSRGRLRPMLSSAPRNPFGLLADRQIRFPKRTRDSWLYCYDALNGRVLRSVYGTTYSVLADDHGHIHRIEAPPGCAQYTTRFVQGRLLANVTLAEQRGPDKLPRRLFEWEEMNGWRDLGPYVFLAYSASGEILMIQRADKQDGPTYLVWPTPKRKA